MSGRDGYKMATIDGGRRVKVVQHEGVDGYMCRWSGACSGCTEYGDYGASEHGGGCRECGHTGRRRQTWWEPLDPLWWAKLDAECDPEPAPRKEGGEER